MNNIDIVQNINNEQSNIITIDKEKILALPYSEKLIYLDTLRIYYPRLNQILERIEECYQSTQTSTRPLCMRISGPSSSGKTTFSEIFQKKYPDVYTPTGIEKPVLYSMLPCPAHVGGLATKLLTDLGDEFSSTTRRIVAQTQRLYNLLKDCNVKIIFLDEVQQLVERNSQKLLRDSSDWFKTLIDETKIPIVFLGMPESGRIFIENEQLANRVRLIEYTNPFTYNDEYRKTLYLYDYSLPIKEISGFANPDLSKRIFIATKGLIKHIHDLIVESTKTAIKYNSNVVTLPMLSQAFIKLLSSQIETNPFTPEFDSYKISEYISHKL